MTAATQLGSQPLDERLMGELIFNFTMTLPLQPTISLENKKKSHLRTKQLEMGAETYVKCSRVLTGEKKNKDTILLFRNLLAIESKRIKETIEAFLINLFYCLS